MIRVFSFLTFMFIGQLACAEIDLDKIEVKDMWVRASNVGDKTTAAYMVITNKNPEYLVLKKADVDFATRSELHHSVTDANQITKMNRIDIINLPYNLNVELKPKSLHVMFYDITSQLDIGGYVDVHLHFADRDGTEFVKECIASIK